MRKRIIKLVSTIAVSAALSAITTIPAFGDSTIKFVRLQTEYEPQAGYVDPSLLNFSPKNNGYQVAFKFNEDPATIGVGERYSITFTLTANKRYNFIDIKPGSCLIQNDENSTLTDMQLSEDGTILTLTYEMSPLVTQLAMPGNPEWGDNLKVKWEPVDYCSGYAANVYSITNRGDLKLVGSVETGKDETVADLKPVMLKEVNDYTFSVTALPTKEEYYLRASEQAYAPLSESKMISQAEIGINTGYFTSDNLQNRYYVYNNQALANGTFLIEGYHYDFDENGHMLFGFQNVDGNKCYFDKDGRLAYGWIEDDKGWYYADPEGHIQTGLQSIDGKSYYMDPEQNGKMIVGWKELDGKQYYFMPDGSMNRDKLIDSNNIVYMFDDNGAVSFQYHASHND